MDGGRENWALCHRSTLSAVYEHQQTGVAVEISPRYDRHTCGRGGVSTPTSYCVELVPEWFDTLPIELTEHVVYAPTFDEAESAARRLMRTYDASTGRRHR